MGLTSREEDILRATIDGTEYTKPPQSRVEELLIELKEAIEQGGGGGGSTVVITPTLQSGEKIADYSINGTPGALYAPEGGGSSLKVVDKLYEASSGAGAPIQTDISYLNSHKLSDYDMITVILSNPTTFAQGTYTQMNSFTPSSLYALPPSGGRIPPSMPVCLVAKEDGVVTVSFNDTGFYIIGHAGTSDDEPSVYCIYGVKFSHVEEEIEINPEGEATDVLEKLKVGNNIYGVEGGGTEVVANPEGEPADVLETIRIGNDILSIPAGGFPYKDNLIFDTNVTSDGTFSLLQSIDNFDALLISGYCAAGSNQPIVSIFVTKSEFYTQKFTLLSTVGMNTRRVFIDFPDDTHVRTDAIEGDISLRNIYGINFGRSTATYTEEVLFEETTDPGGSRTITLSKELRNFDAIYFRYWTVGEQETFLDSANSPMYDIKPNNKGNVYIVSYPGYENRYIIFSGTPTEKSATLTTGAWNESAYRPGVYQIVGVRYGNDESSPFKKDLLWSGVARLADTTGHLGKPITEYPFLMMYYSDSSVAGMNEWHVELVDTSKLTDYENNMFSYEYYGTAYIRGKFVDPSNFLITTSMADAGVYPVLREIYGVDFGSGNGQNGSFQKDLLYAASTVSGAPLRTDIPYLTDRNFFDYDLITLIQCNVLDTPNNMVLSPCSFTPDELYKISDGVYELNVTGYKERYMRITFSEHSFNISYHAAVNESGEYAPSIYKMYGFKFGGNNDILKVSKYLPSTLKANMVCEASMDNFDNTSLSWGEGPTPIDLTSLVSTQDGGVLIPVKSDGTFASVYREAPNRPFTAYIVAKLINPGAASRVLATLYERTPNKGILLSGNPVHVSSWANDTSTGESATDYFVGVLQYQTTGAAFGKVNNVSRIWKPTIGISDRITIGRTDINPSGSDEEPCDIVVKYFGLVDGIESINAIDSNVASLMERFNIS